MSDYDRAMKIATLCAERLGKQPYVVEPDGAPLSIEWPKALTAKERRTYDEIVAEVDAPTAFDQIPTDATLAEVIGRINLLLAALPEAAQPRTPPTDRTTP